MREGISSYILHERACILFDTASMHRRLQRVHACTSCVNLSVPSHAELVSDIAGGDVVIVMTIEARLCAK